MNLIHSFVFILLYLFTLISATVSPEADPAQLVTLEKAQFIESLKQVTFDYLKSELNITDDKILNDLFQKEFPSYFAEYSSEISFANDEAVQKFKEHFRTNIESVLSSEMLTDFKDLLRNNANELSKVNDAYKEMRADASTLQSLQKEYDTYLLRWKDVKIAKDHFLFELKVFLQSLTLQGVNLSCPQKYRNFEERSKRLIFFLEPSEGNHEYCFHTIKSTSFRYAVDIYSITLYKEFMNAFISLIEEINWLDPSFPSVSISKMQNNIIEYLNKFEFLDDQIFESIQFRISDKSKCWSLEGIGNELKRMVTEEEKTFDEKYKDEKYNFHGKPIHVLLGHYESVEAYMRGKFAFLMKNTVSKTKLADYTTYVTPKNVKNSSNIQKPAEKPKGCCRTRYIVILFFGFGIGIVIVVVVIVKRKKNKYSVKERFLEDDFVVARI